MPWPQQRRRCRVAVAAPVVEAVAAAATKAPIAICRAVCVTPQHCCELFQRLAHGIAAYDAACVLDVGRYLLQQPIEAVEARLVTQVIHE